MGYYLAKFYISLWNWLETGNGMFLHSQGLCSNLKDFLRAKGMSGCESDAVLFELRRQFEESGLDGRYPFNAACSDEFVHESISRSMYQNNARLDWVKTRAHVQMDVRGATIQAAEMELRCGDLLEVKLVLECNGSRQVIHAPGADRLIRRIMEISCVDSWSALPGAHVRIASGSDGTVSLGCFLKEDWITPDKGFKTLKRSMK
mgnify:CR=1 FL=1